MSRVGPFALLVFCLSLVTLLSVSAGSEQAVVTVDVQAAKDLLASGYRFLDVRTEKEFTNGHVENALNVPFWFFTAEGKEVNPRFVEQVSAVCSKDDKLVVACQCGIRSLDASIELLKAGYKNVRNMEGGYGSWLGNGFNVVKLPKDEL
ncbi:rhodanese-like domain-containing protein 17 [Nymphaea colorata]|nr:rhodanese-like domain-containing protein 17 [Nymphaea colorata]